MAELVIDALVENLDAVHDFVHNSIADLGCSKKFIFQLDLVVEEIFVNIAEYAYTPNVGLAKILSEVDGDSKKVSLTFIDSGVEYDPLKKSDPDIDLELEERQIGGLGIFLTKNLVDDISYRYVDGQNILQIMKSAAN